MWYNAIGCVVTLILGLLTAPATHAQQLAKVARIGVLRLGSPPAPGTPAFFEPFVHGLRDLGYVEGQHFVLEYRYTEGNNDRLPALATELVRLPVHILLVSGTPSLVQAAKHATTTIPIVFVGVFDPV